MQIISVITVCKNAEATIASTIKSVLDQTGVTIQYIIKDGASTDRTVEIIASYSDPRIKLIQGRDNGLYDAMNIASSYVTGDYIFFLNADDVFVKENSLSNALSVISRDTWNYFPAMLVKGRRNSSRLLSQCLSKDTLCKIRCEYIQCGWFLRTGQFQSVAPFETRYRIAADYLMLRLLLRNYGHPMIHSFPMVSMKPGGISDVQFRRSIEEFRRISIDQGDSKILAWAIWLVKYLNYQRKATRLFR